MDSLTGGYGFIDVQGWAFDQSKSSSAVSIHVYIGGTPGTTGAEGHDIGATSVTRSDVNIAYNITGVHGFSRRIPTNKRGEQTVYIYAINIGEGSNVLLKQQTVTISNATPVGNYESAAGGAGTVTVTGWALDYSDRLSSVSIHVYIGGTPGTTGAEGHDIGATSVTRSDINNTYNVTGAHGFNKKIVTAKRGTQNVYVYAINFDDGTNKLLGSKTVTITGNPVGGFESASGGAGTFTVKGWAFDYDEPSDAVNIHVYIGGTAGAANATGYSILTNVNRSDINSTYNITGTHGFERTFTTDKRGTQEVYIYAINIGEGTNTLLGHKTVTITGNPVGNLESATGGDGTVSVIGWAFDPDQPSDAIHIHVYIGGPSGSANAIGYNLRETTVLRTDVNNNKGITGNHGFNSTISTTKTGSQPIYVYAINVGAGSTTLLGTKTVTIA